MATVAELEKQIAGLNNQLKYGAGLQLREREEAAAFTRQLIVKAEAAGDQAKVERETQLLGTILQEISTYKQEVAGIEAQRNQLQQELNTQKAVEQSQRATSQRANPPSFRFEQDPDTGNWQVIDDTTGKVYRGFDPLGAANDAIRSLPNLLPSEIAALQAQARDIEADLKAQQLAKTQGNNNAQSAGEQVAQSGDAGVTNPAQPTQTFTSPDAATTTATQPDPVVAESNSNTPAIGVTSSPSPDATASVVQTNAEEAVNRGGSLPPTETVATAESKTEQSYVFTAISVVSEFRQGRFEQTLEGTLYFFPRPKTSQLVDPPVKAADLGSQSFGLTDNPRVNPGKKKVASAQDVRKATITPAVPTNVQFTGQPSNLSNPDGMDFSAISGFGA